MSSLTALARAEEPGRAGRPFFKIGVGPQYTWQTTTQDDVEYKTEVERFEASGLAIAFHAAAGVSVSRSVALGAAYGVSFADLNGALIESEFGTGGEIGRTDASGSLKLELVGPMLHAYFDRGRHVYVHLVIGYSSASFEYQPAVYAPGTGHAEGLGFGVGGGYDFWVSDRFALGPQLWLVAVSEGYGVFGVERDDEHRYTSAQALAFMISATLF